LHGIERKILRIEPSPPLDDHGLLHHSLELADVPEPGMAGEAFEGAVPHTVDREPVAGVDRPADVLDQNREVVEPRAEWRDLEDDMSERYAIVEEAMLQEAGARLTEGPRAKRRSHVAKWSN
jgi:hypothetical protein